LAAPNLAEHDVTSLRRFCCMGAPIPRALVREARAKLPRMVAVGGWGQSEYGLVALGIPGDPDEKVIGTDGYPSPGMWIRVVGPDGESAPVSYVESALYEHPDVEAVAVVAVPDPRLQERACACVVQAAGSAELTLPGMQDFLRSAGVAKQYWPERLEALAELPRTPSGKIQKYQLRDRLGAH
jgi:acyl-coenzyme A synthetase/AMP-(fatty) acid ligase